LIFIAYTIALGIYNSPLTVAHNQGIFTIISPSVSHGGYPKYPTPPQKNRAAPTAKEVGSTLTSQAGELGSCGIQLWQDVFVKIYIYIYIYIYLFTYIYIYHYIIIVIIINTIILMLILINTNNNTNTNTNKY